MAYYYVKSGYGTNTATDTGFATQQTGAFSSITASSCYASVADAVQYGTAMTSGDFICCSDLHNVTYTASKIISLDDGTTIISVDDANVENYKAGATENSVASGYIGFAITGVGNRTAVFQGVDIFCDDEFNLNRTSGSTIIYRDATLGYGGATNDARMRVDTDDGCEAILENIIIQPPSRFNEELFNIARGGAVTWMGGSLTSVTYPPETLCRIGSNGGGHLRCDGVDLSNMSSGFGLYFTVDYTQDNTTLSLNNCTMPASWVMGGTLECAGYIEVYNCDDGSLPINGFINKHGKALATTSVYDSGADTVQSVRASLEITTESETNTAHCFKVKVGAVHADFSTSKTVTLHMAHDALGSGTGSRFYDSEAWIEVHVPKSSGKAKTIERSGGEVFKTTTTNAASTNTWTGTSMTSETKEKIELTTTSGGGGGWADVYVCIGVASIGASGLFVSHDITVA